MTPVNRAREVTSVSSVSSSLSKRVLFQHEARPRPFRVCSHDRLRRTGVVATTLDDLLAKAANALRLTSATLSLVVDEDGTMVESEDFFQSLETNMQLMLLEDGQRWTPVKDISDRRWSKKSGIAKFTFDLYKLNPKDFIGCLTVKATFYEMYSMSYDFKCTGAKSVLKKVLHYFSCLAQVTGHFLLYTSSYVLQCIGEEEQTAPE
ncbi:lipid transferase CIDEA isoform X2 [Amia ocellicauda]|uniref:lipid transferase CIDEA isoform X2 n=1 Tax=Amia ocellicauda TaxID=2972642 RepID=UPI003463E0CF